MGDRRNVLLYNPGEAEQVEGKVVVQDGAKPIYLYTHWLGYRLPEVVQTAIARRARWNDDAYLNRIIVSTVLKEVGIDDETGAGLSLYVCDSNYDDEVEVFGDLNLVRIGEKVWTFEDYATADVTGI
jgi:hypothetical protein